MRASRSVEGGSGGGFGFGGGLERERVRRRDVSAVVGSGVSLGGLAERGGVLVGGECPGRFSGWLFGGEGLFAIGGEGILLALGRLFAFA